MKKLTSILIACILALTLCGAALAETVSYSDPDEDFTFDYDTAAFQIELEDHGTEEVDSFMLVLSAIVEDWGETSITFSRTELEEGQTLASAMETVGTSGVAITEGEWNGFPQVFMYTIEDNGNLAQCFVLPIDDDDILLIGVAVTEIEDEELAMARDDAISAVLDTLKLIDD